VPGVEVRIISRCGADAPAGTDGEIVVRGYEVMPGYLDDPAATAQAIDDDGWLHTGDVGRLDELGRLTVTDRLKDMFLVGGFNTYPAEVEQALSQHQAIADVSVVGVPDDRLGEVGLAFVILQEGAAATPGELTSWARERLANYKVPRHWRFVTELPRNASGKTLKHLLRAAGREAGSGGQAPASASSGPASPAAEAI
jgi:acyl-CoA synthetase (AMP-forming)/AMP-acid ligase II